MYNISSVVFLSLGNAVGILMGQMLGAGNTAETIRDSNRKLITMNVLVGVVFPNCVLFYARSAFFRHRLREDLQLIIKTNKEIQDIIYERKF